MLDYPLPTGAKPAYALPPGSKPTDISGAPFEMSLTNVMRDVGTGVERGAVTGAMAPLDIAHTLMQLLTKEPYGPFAPGDVGPPSDVASKALGIGEPETAAGRVVGRVTQETVGAVTMTPVMRAMGLLRQVPLAQLLKMEAAVGARAGVGAAAGKEVAGQGGDLLGQLVGGFGYEGARGFLRQAIKEAKAQTPEQVVRTAGGQPGVAAGVQEATALNEEIPGLNLRTAQAAESPTVSAAERRATAASPEVAEGLTERQRGAPAAIQQYGQERLGVPTEGSLEAAQAVAGRQVSTARAATAAPVTAAERSLAAARQADAETARMLNVNADRYAADLDGAFGEQLKTITGSMAEKEDAARKMVDLFTAQKALVRKQVGALYTKIDPANAAKGTAEPVAKAIDAVAADAASSLRGDILPPTVSNLAKRVREPLTEEDIVLAKDVAKRLGLPVTDPKVQAQLGEMGVKAQTREVGFNELARWRSDLLDEIRDQSSGPKPNRQAVRYLNQLVDSVEEAMTGAAERGGPEVLARYREAQAAAKDAVNTFDKGIIGRLLQRNRLGELSTQPGRLGELPQVFMKSDMALDQYLKAIGDKNVGLQLLRDWSFRDFLSAAIEPGGLNVNRAEKWLAVNDRALQKIPELRQEIEAVVAQGKNVASGQAFAAQMKKLPGQPLGRSIIAEDQLATAQTMAKRSLAEIDKSAAALFAGAEDPKQAIRVLQDRGNPSEIRAVAQAVQGDPAALRGLKRALWDEFGQANPWASPELMRRFTNQYGTLITELYGPDALKTLGTMQRAAELLSRGGGITTNVDLAKFGVDEKTITVMGAILNRAGVQFAKRAVGKALGLEAFTQPEAQALLKGALFEPSVAQALIEAGKPGRMQTLRNWLHAEYALAGANVVKQFTR